MPRSVTHLAATQHVQYTQRIVGVGGCPAVVAQWQSTVGSSQRCPGFDSQWLPAFFTFLYLRLITSNFIYQEPLCSLPMLLTLLAYQDIMCGDQSITTLQHIPQRGLQLLKLALTSKSGQLPILKAQMFTECQIPRAWTTKIHLEMIPHMYLSGTQKLQCFREYENSSPTHKSISAHFNCLFFGHNNIISFQSVIVNTLLGFGSTELVKVTKTMTSLHTTHDKE